MLLLALPLALWTSALLTRGIRQILALLFAPIVLAALTPMGLDLTGLAAAAGVGVGAIPLFRALGPTWPRWRALAIVGGALALATAFMVVTPPGRLLLASDLGEGAFVVALGAGLLALSALPP